MPDSRPRPRSEYDSSSRVIAFRCPSFCLVHGRANTKTCKVPGPGLEPGLPCGKGILSPSRLPVSPSRHSTSIRTTVALRLGDRRLQRHFCARIAISAHHPEHEEGSSSEGPSRSPLLCSPLESGKRDSNPRPQPWQGCALPTELFPRAENIPENRDSTIAPRPLTVVHPAR
jgi:hypothetical protein